ncbi:MAG: hypothetical protein IT204_04570 [Fimbriimonadaceae bacterium]|nr:hypothetical protein [Fimbriimonadaceae bacterium]
MTAADGPEPPPTARWLDRLALLISAVSSPFVVLPIFIGVLLTGTTLTWQQAAQWGALAAVGLVGLPLGYILLGIRRGEIGDVHVASLQQRQGPFFVGIVGAVFTAFALAVAGAPMELQLGALGMAINGLPFALISRRWKISMHPSTLAACAVLAGMVVGRIWLWTCLALPLVMWARVQRRRHDWAQGIIASLLSAGLTALMVVVYQRWLADGVVIPR